MENILFLKFILELQEELKLGRFLGYRIYSLGFYKINYIQKMSSKSSVETDEIFHNTFNGPLHYNCFFFIRNFTL